MSVETIALIPRSKLPAAASSNHWEICTVLRLVSMLSVSFSIAWMATDQSLKVAASRTRNVRFLIPPACPASAMSFFASWTAGLVSFW